MDESLRIFAAQYWALAVEFKADLFGYREFDAFLDEGVSPCLELAEKIPASAVLLDIGSGGGLPGLVFAKLQPEARIHLLEPRQKRWVFLRETAAALRLENIAAHRGQLPGFVFPATLRFDRISVRGLKLTPAMLKAVAPNIAPDPLFLLFHADNAAQVRKAGWNAALSA